MKHATILFVATQGELSRVDPLAAALRREGRRVTLTLDVDDALGLPTPDVLIVTAAAGVELFAAFDLPVGAPKRIALCETESFDTAVAAMRAGADELLVLPTASELTAACTPRHPATLRVHTERSYDESYLVGPDIPGGTHRPVLDLLAFCTRLGHERALRFRVATALSLAVDGVAHNAYPATEGSLEVSVRIADSRLALSLVDRGAGYDAAGLDQLRSLTERLDLASGPEGTTLSMEFELAPLRFEEQPPELDELDYLDPSACRELTELVRAGDLDLPGAVAPTLGRLLDAGRLASDPLTCLSA
ncbi:MAG: hypothetical protein P1V81_11090 [Planctomycetota bacterium]|nr:hypothetical protein [Planctomycetota bacterium]